MCVCGGGAMYVCVECSMYGCDCVILFVKGVCMCIPTCSMCLCVCVCVQVCNVLCEHWNLSEIEQTNENKDK